MVTALKRIVRSGFNNFFRNSFVSLASVLVMVVTLFVIGGMIFLSSILNASLGEIREKVDVNVYFLPGAVEEDVLVLQEKIEALPEVEEVTYQSREDALAEFRERHSDDASTLQALDELDDNPLGAVLNIKASEPSQYASVAEFLQGDNLLNDNGERIVDQVNYFQNKAAINLLTQIIDSVEMFGIIISSVLIALSVLIMFNTIRLAIYISREEIGVMRLVGASNSYIRGPFMMTGIIYGVISGIVTLIIFFPVAYWLGQGTEVFFEGFDVDNYYLDNFVQIFALIFGAGIILGVFSSFLAVTKYLRR